MKKTDKKRENALRHALTEVCEQTLDVVAGFTWVTHRVDYARFPQSLRIICVFETDDNLFQAEHEGALSALSASIVKSLADINIKIQSADKHIFFDSEQACTREHAGDWDSRLRKI